MSGANRFGRSWLGLSGKTVNLTSTSVATKVGSGSDTLTLKITQDAYRGDSQYATFADGRLIDGSAAADCNLYVECATYIGSAVSGGYQYVNASDAKRFTVAASTAIPSTSTPPPTLIRQDPARMKG